MTLRRADDDVRVHAGDGARERPRGGVLRAAAGGGGARGVEALKDTNREYDSKRTSGLPDSPAMQQRRLSRRLIQAALVVAVSGCAQAPPSPAAPTPSSPTTTELHKEVQALRADVDKLTARLDEGPCAAGVVVRRAVSDQLSLQEQWRQLGGVEGQDRHGHDRGGGLRRAHQVVRRRPLRGWQVHQRLVRAHPGDHAERLRPRLSRPQEFQPNAPPGAGPGKLGIHGHDPRAGPAAGLALGLRHTPTTAASTHSTHHGGQDGGQDAREDSFLALGLRPRRWRPRRPLPPSPTPSPMPSTPSRISRAHRVTAITPSTASRRRRVGQRSRPQRRTPRARPPGTRCSSTPASAANN